MKKATIVGWTGWLVALLSALLAGWLLAFEAQAQESAPADWTGTWETIWRGSGARLILEQDGATVTGTYPLFEGRIEAVARGNELSGRWMQPDQSGTFLFVQSQDGQSFTGRFGSGEWWTGARGESEEAASMRVDQSSPIATMTSFLAAANEAVDGNLEAISDAVALVRPEEDADGVVDRFQLARLLYAVIDETTFRVWDLPHEADDGPDGVRATAVLDQAGTDESVTIDFVRQGGRWHLVSPAADSLVAIRDRLRAARAEASGHADDDGSLRTPRDAMRTFLLGFRRSPEGADPGTLSALDLSGRPEVTRAHDGRLLAGYLKRVIDRTGYVIWQEIPDDPESREPYVHFVHPAGRIVIAPVPVEDGVVWQFSDETLASIRSVYTAMEDMPIAPGLRALPDQDIHFAIRNLLRGVAPAALLPLGPMERWQWAALAATLSATLLAAWITGRAIYVFAPRRLAGRSLDHLLLAGPGSWAARGLAAGLVLLAAGWFLGMPDAFTLVLTTTATVFLVIGVFLLGWRAVGTAAERYRNAEGVIGHNLVPLVLSAGVLRGMLLIAAVFVLAHAFSLPITGVIAGFGIGGIAVALAVQPTLQNLLSGFTLYADRPISVGDFCRFGDKMGTVEYIGLRSTRLRTLDRTVISVPNSQFLDMELENFARRDRFLFTTVVQLRYETTPDQMRYVLVELRKLLIAHPKVLPDPLRVRFAGFGAHSLDVEVFSYILAADIDEFTAIREDVLLRFMSTVDEAGAQFAFPSMVHYTAEDEASDPDRVRRAEAHVDEWRRSEALPFPDFDWQSKAELSGSLDYPPDGSAFQRKDSQGRDSQD